MVALCKEFAHKRDCVIASLDFKVQFAPTLLKNMLLSLLRYLVKLINSILTCQQ